MPEPTERGTSLMKGLPILWAVVLLLVALGLLVAVACGGSGSTTPTATPAPGLKATPTPTVRPTAAAEAVAEPTVFVTSVPAQEVQPSIPLTAPTPALDPCRLYPGTTYDPGQNLCLCPTGTSWDGNVQRCVAPIVSEQAAIALVLAYMKNNSNQICDFYPIFSTGWQPGQWFVTCRMADSDCRLLAMFAGQDPDSVCQPVDFSFIVFEATLQVVPADTNTQLCLGSFPCTQ